MMWELFQLVLVGVFSAGGAWAALSVKLRWQWSEIKRAHRRLDQHQRLIDDLRFEK